MEEKQERKESRQPLLGTNGQSRAAQSRWGTWKKVFGALIGFVLVMFFAQCLIKRSAFFSPQKKVLPKNNRFVPQLLFDESFSSGYGNEKTVSEGQTNSFHPVVLAHGMGDSCYNPGMESIEVLVGLWLDGTYVKCIPIGDSIFEDTVNAYGLTMNEQVAQFADAIQRDEKLKDGFNAMGFSQGNLLIRAYVQQYSFKPQYPTLHSFVSVHGPLLGVAALPRCDPGAGFQKYFCQLLNSLTSQVAYSTMIQNSLAQANYYRNPFYIQEYMTTSFLPALNFERQEADSEKKETIAGLDSLDQLVLIRAEQDTMIFPSDSEWFGFFKDDSFEEVEQYYETRFFEPIGLKKLALESKLFFEQTPGDHLQFSRAFLKHMVTKYWKNN